MAGSMHKAWGKESWPREQERESQGVHTQAGWKTLSRPFLSWSWIPHQGQGFICHSVNKGDLEFLRSKPFRPHRTEVHTGSVLSSWGILALYFTSLELPLHDWILHKPGWPQWHHSPHHHPFPFLKLHVPFGSEQKQFNRKDRRRSALNNNPWHIDWLFFL